MTPAEIIARALLEWSGSGQGVDDMLVEISQSQSSAIISALRAAGYDIVGPGEYHARSFNAGVDHATIWDHEWPEDRKRAIVAAAIRALEAKG